MITCHIVFCQVSVIKLAKSDATTSGYHKPHTLTIISLLPHGCCSGNKRRHVNPQHIFNLHNPNRFVGVTRQVFIIIWFFPNSIASERTMLSVLIRVVMPPSTQLILVPNNCISSGYLLQKQNLVCTPTPITEMLVRTVLV